MNNTQIPQVKQTEHSKCKRVIELCLKFGVVIALCVFMVFNTLYGLANPAVDIACLYDMFFEFTNSINFFFQNHLLIKKYILIFTSLFVDGCILTSLIHWSFYGRSFRFFFTFILFYISHMIIRLTFFVEYPEGYLWGYPGFPSLFVSYTKTNAMFFSNPIGLLIICFMEWKLLKKKLHMFLTISILIIESITMICFRAHYIIDIFAGIVFGHYFFIIISANVGYFDKKFISEKTKREITLVEDKEIRTDTDYAEKKEEIEIEIQEK